MDAYGTYKVPMLSVMSDLCVLGGDVALCHDWKGESNVTVLIRITFMRMRIPLFGPPFLAFTALEF